MTLMHIFAECGAGFTAKLETMAKDIDLSSDIMNAYRSALPPESAADSTINVNILTAGNWPTYTKLPCRVPADMQKELDRFTAFYKNKHAGRSLAWVHGLDHCAIRADFKAGKGGGRKELNVSLTQALVILLFNYTDEDRKLGYKEIMAQTGLGRHTMRLHIVIELIPSIPSRREQRVGAHSAISGLCKVQDTHKAPKGPRCQRDRRIFV